MVPCIVGTSNYTTLMWAGDQNVDWSAGDGLPSVIPAALSSGLCGIGMTHIDIGLYTTFGALGLKRSAELLLRSAEMAVFSPVMRTHEGTLCRVIPCVQSFLHTEEYNIVIICNPHSFI